MREEHSSSALVQDDATADAVANTEAVTKAAQTSLKTGNVYGETQKTTMEKGKAELSTIEASISEAKAEELSARVGRACPRPRATAVRRPGRPLG